MEVLVKVRTIGLEPTWEENYVLDAETHEEAVAGAKRILEHYNKTLRPHEKPREFLSVKIVGEKVKHDWEKASVFTEQGGFDKYRCTRCRVTGKRYGLSNVIKVDYRFRKHELCTPGF